MIVMKRSRMPRSPRRLPVVRYHGKLYYRDDRLHELRAVDDPFNVIRFYILH